MADGMSFEGITLSPSFYGLYEDFMFVYVSRNNLIETILSLYVKEKDREKTKKQSYEKMHCTLH